MTTRDPEDVEAYERDLAGVLIGGPQPLTAPIEVRAYDPAWPALYESTSVPGLPAKPIIDIGLEVPDSADEAAYAPDMEAAGYVLRVRESDWFEHRLFNGPDTDVNVHVFPAGCQELDRMLLFRDHLRADTADRQRYAAAKRELAARPWRYMQQYADAKTAVVREIMARAEAGSSR